MRCGAGPLLPVQRATWRVCAVVSSQHGVMRGGLRGVALVSGVVGRPRGDLPSAPDGLEALDGEVLPPGLVRVAELQLL